MNTRKIALGVALSVALLTSAVTIAQSVDARRNPNLAEAQRLIHQALGRLDAAQEANHDDMEGHAARAKDLLVQADHEIKLAAEVADHHRR
ncbi:MAG: hypothetical protein WBM14_03050 [Terracidiphilus sp.]